MFSSACHAHIWHFSYDRLNSRLSGARDILSDEEKERRDKFIYENDRRRYVLGRIMLRRLLGQYTDESPKSVKITTGLLGKPECDGIQFSVSHSGDCLIIALTARERIGVDVERVREMKSWYSIAQRFFHPSEYRELASAELQYIPRWFFSCWVRKEAYIKALGYGLYLPLNTFQVTVNPEVKPILVQNEISPDEVSRWAFRDLASREGYIGAVAMEASDLLISYASAHAVDALAAGKKTGRIEKCRRLAVTRQ